MGSLPQYFGELVTERDDSEKSLLKQIQIDVLRTNPSCSLFQNAIIQEV